MVNETEAELVRLIFRRFLRVGSATKLAQELRSAGHTTKSWTTQDGKHRPGKPIDKGALYKILSNRVYLGEAVHKGTTLSRRARGDHRSRDLGQGARHPRREHGRSRQRHARADAGVAARPDLRARRARDDAVAHAQELASLYRYYVATDAIRQGYAECPVRSVPAAEVEEAVVAQVRHLLRTPEIIARTWAAAKSEGDEAIPERDVVKTITDFAPLWDELFPAEQARIVRLLVERIDLAPDGMQVRLRAEGLQTLVEELRSRGGQGGMKAKWKAGQNWEFDGTDHHRPHPDDLEAPRRPQGDHRAGRRRCLGAGEAAAGRDADPRAGAGASVEAVDRGWDYDRRRRSQKQRA